MIFAQICDFLRGKWMRTGNGQFNSPFYGRARCVPLFENDQKIFWYDELFSPKSHTLAGSVSELSHTGEIFWPPNGAIRWMQQYACIRLNTFAALKFSTLTRGGGGWRPFLHLHVKWCFDDVLIFRCVPLSKNDQIVFEILNYFPQKRTLWRGQSLSSPILLRRRFSDPPNAANRWMQQCVCIRLNASA